MVKAFQYRAFQRDAFQTRTRARINIYASYFGLHTRYPASIRVAARILPGGGGTGSTGRSMKEPSRVGLSGDELGENFEAAALDGQYIRQVAARQPHRDSGGVHDIGH